MTEKKKYEAPQMEVAKVDAASIICTSGQLQQDGASFEDYQDGEFSWE